jgi:hypothetical protein
VPYERFKEVNSKAQAYEEALTELIDNPEAYRNLVKHYTGKDPLEGFTGGATVAEGGGKEDDSMSSVVAGLPQLTREDFATETDWSVYQTQQTALKALATKLDALEGSGKKLAEQTEADKQTREIEVAKVHFGEVVTQIEKDLGIQVTPEEKRALIKEAKTYGNMPVKEALVRASKVVYFERAMQLGRESATKIADDKTKVAGGRPPAAGGGGTGGGNRTGLSLDDAVAYAIGKHGV